jgi:hypothetical protein
MYTLQGKTRLTRHTHSTLSPRMVLDHTYCTRSTHSNLSRTRQQICTDPLPQRRRAPEIIHSSTAVWSTGPYPASLPQQSMRQWGKDKLLHVIRTFNTCSRGPTHRSLTNTAGATALKAPTFHIPLPDHPYQRSPLFTYGPRPVSSLTTIPLTKPEFWV